MNTLHGRSGFASIVGAPNVGKSTLLNRILGQKIAIVTPKPQTTRDRILGVLTRERGQIVWLDTPGVHDARDPLNRYMVEQALAGLADADAVVFVVDALAAERGHDRFDSDIAERIAKSGKPTIVCLNKVDALTPKDRLLPQIAAWTERLSPRAVIPISALEGDGVEALLAEIWEVLPEGPFYFDGDALTDRSQRWLAAELIRERIFFKLRKEVPYSTAVQIERFEEREEKGDLVIEAVVYVERDSQKAIIVGKGGQMIKAIGTAARESLTEFFERPVHVMLRVKVESDWSESRRGLRRVGYDT